MKDPAKMGKAAAAIERMANHVFDSCTKTISDQASDAVLYFDVPDSEYCPHYWPNKPIVDHVMDAILTEIQSHE